VEWQAFYKVEYDLQNEAHEKAELAARAESGFKEAVRDSRKR
jgi:hypothetical protein